MIVNHSRQRAAIQFVPPSHPSVQKGSDMNFDIFLEYFPLSYQPTDKVIKAGGGAVDSVCYVLYIL